MPIPIIIIAIILIIGVAGGTTYYLYQSGYFNQFQTNNEPQQNSTANGGQNSGNDSTGTNPVVATPIVYP